MGAILFFAVVVVFVGWPSGRVLASPSKRSSRFVAQQTSIPAGTSVAVAEQDREVILRLYMLLYMEMLENLKLYQYFDMFNFAVTVTTTQPPVSPKKP